MNKFEGIFPALVTPFKKDGSVNTQQLTKLIEYNIEKGVDGFYVDGSTGEAFLLTLDERRQILKAAAEANAGRCTLIAQIGCIATEQSVQLAQYCESLGYDAVSSVAPFYYKFSYSEIRDYYFSIAASCELPMFIYNIPALSGVTLSAENLGEFLRDERFMGVKYTSNDYFTLERLKNAFPDKIIYNGYDEMMLAGLSMGADGGIGSTYNFMADKFIALKKCFDCGDIVGAREYQRSANAVIDKLLNVGIMPAQKYMLDLLGFDCGGCRAPFKELTADEKLHLKTDVLPLILN